MEDIASWNEGSDQVYGICSHKDFFGFFYNKEILKAAGYEKFPESWDELYKLCEKLKESFDYVIIDCPAGIEQGFKNAIAGADRAIVVTNPEVSAVRDADRIIGLLEANEISDIRLIINRIRQDMVKRGDMMDKHDIVEILAIDLIGIVPDDESIIISTNKGEPAILDSKSNAGKAYKNIAQRILGNNIPIMEVEQETNFFGKIKKMFGVAK